MARQLTLTDDQWASLQAIAHETGQTTEQLVIAAVEQLIRQHEQQRHERWLAALRQVRGMWADRDDLPELFAEMRREWDRNPWDE